MESPEAPRPDRSALDAARPVLIVAPRGRNAELLYRALERAGVAAMVCPGIEDLCGRTNEQTGALLVCEEAFTRAAIAALQGALGRQGPWSDIPVLVLTGGGRTTRGSFRVAAALGGRGNLTLLDRPVRIITLVSAVRAALRARSRQHEVRDLLARQDAARAQAEAASLAKDHFLAALSHELRTPLNPVLISVSAMVRDPGVPAHLREDLESVKRNVELEARLIDDLLDLTRIARGKLELHHEAVDLHDLLRHISRTGSEGDAGIRKHDLILDLAARRPHVWADPARLSQVFWNLVRNSVKFTQDGGTIRVSTRDEPDGTLVATVTDTGIGIEPGAVGRIFDAFEQADRTITRQYGGLGLGLAISKSLVSLHGGTISAHSEGLGKGATFTVRLTSIPRPQARHRHATLGDGRSRQLAILLVEDHVETAKVMGRLLKSMGHDVTVATDVSSARRSFDARPYDLIISDLGLPDGTGLDLIRHLRQRSCVPAIAISGYGMEEDLRQSRIAGFDEHLVKPIDVSKLRGAVDRLGRPGR